AAFPTGDNGFHPMALIVVTPFVMAVTFLAAYIPARRASRLDPMKALRYEGAARQERAPREARDICLIAPFSRYTTPPGGEPAMDSAAKARPISSCSIVPNRPGIRRPSQAA